MKTKTRMTLFSAGGTALTVAGVLLPVASGIANAEVVMNASDAQMIPQDGGKLNQTIFGSVHGEPLYMQFYTAKVNGKDMQALCLNYDKLTPNGDAKKTGAPSEQEWKVVKDGLGVSPASLGIHGNNTWPTRDNDLQWRATQIALWIEAGNFSFNDVSWNNDQYSQQVKNAVQKILDNVANDHSAMADPTGAMKVTEIKVDPNTGETTVTMQASATTGVKDAKLQINNLPNGAKITQDGKTINNGDGFDISKPITVTVPASEKASQMQATWSGTSDEQIPDAAIFGAPNGTQQSSLVFTMNGNASVNGKADVPITATEGSLTLHKVDSKNQPVAGVKFDLVNSAGKTVATQMTDKDGNVHFSNLLPGQYTAKEEDAPIQVRIDHGSTPVVVSAGQEGKATIGNTTVGGKISSTTVADDNLHMTDATKGGNLNETLNYKDVTTGVQLRRVTKLVYAGTNDPVKINGKEVTDTYDFTADKSDFSQTFKLPVDYSQLEGKNVTTMTTLYRVKGDQTLMLSQETNNNDPAQSVQSLQPKIQTLDSVAANGKAGNQEVNPSKVTSVTDQYTATNLIKGHKYTADFAEYDQNGKIVPGSQTSKEFTADGSTQTISATLPNFDTTKYAGQNLTIHSDIKLSDGTIAAKDDSQDNKNEQIHVTKPTMETTALINNGKTENPNGATTLSDRVAYHNVTPGQPLNFKVIARDAQGNPITTTVNGKEYYLEGNVNFTPQQADGTVDVPLMQVNVKDKDGKDVTASSATSETTNRDAKASSTSATSKSVQDVNASDPLSKQINDWGKGVSQLASGSSQASSSASSQSANKDAQSSDENANLNTPNAADWKAGSADADDKAITINPINAGDAAADPVKAGHTAGGSDLKNPYQIDTHALAGKDLGLSENMASNDTGSGNGWTNEAHHDAHDSTSQVVHVTNPQLHTEALLSNGHSDMPSKEAQLFDKVDYSDVVPGHPVEISTMMYDKNTKQPETVKVNGKTMYLVGRITFTPKNSSGSVNVPLQEVETPKDFDPAKLTLQGNTADAAALRIDSNSLKVASPLGQETATKAAQSAAKSAMSSAKGNDSEKASAASSAAQSAANKVIGDSETAKPAATQGAASAGVNFGNATSATTGSAKASSASSASSESGVAKDANNAIKNGDVNGTADATAAANGDTKASWIDTTDLAGKSMVAVEDLSQYVGGTSSTTTTAQNWITSEADVNNDKQTVNVAKPWIKTTAAINGGKNITFEKGSHTKIKTLSDTVTYGNMVPGKPQKITVVEMDKSTGKPVKIDGKYLVGTKTITPDKSEGQVTVPFHTTDKLPDTAYTNSSLGQVIKSDDGVTATPAESSSSSASSTTSSSKASSASSESQSQDDSQDLGIDLSKLTSQANWVAFETTENVGQGNNVTAEHKDLGDQGETVTITPKDKQTTPTVTGGSQVQSQKQSQLATANAQGGNAQGGQGTNGGGATSPAGTAGTAGGAGTNGGGAAGTTGATPRFAQTGGSGHFDKLVDFVYNLFH